MAAGAWKDVEGVDGGKTVSHAVGAGETAACSVQSVLAWRIRELIYERVDLVKISRKNIATAHGFL